MAAPVAYRFYGDLARWWPLISPPAEYEEESEFIASLLQQASIPVETVLELGSGGGHVASHLKRHFSMTLVDLSPEMLEVSRQLNPQCEHVAGDMRTIDLERQYDAVLIYDAVDYMTTEHDLGLAITNAYRHCRPGGVALFVPDHIRENLLLETDHGGHDGTDGRRVRYLEWSTDPDPDDTEILTDYVFLLLDRDGTVEVVHETHRTGLFPRATWLRLVGEAGFAAQVIVEQTSENRIPRELFLGNRPR
jgi:SAM-dependent methyltransferase